MEMTDKEYTDFLSVRKVDKELKKLCKYFLEDYIDRLVDSSYGDWKYPAWLSEETKEYIIQKSVEDQDGNTRKMFEQSNYDLLVTKIVKDYLFKE